MCFSPQCSQSANSLSFNLLYLYIHFLSILSSRYLYHAEIQLVVCIHFVAAYQGLFTIFLLHIKLNANWSFWRRDARKSANCISVCVFVGRHCNPTDWEQLSSHKMLWTSLELQICSETKHFLKRWIHMAIFEPKSTHKIFLMLFLKLNFTAHLYILDCSILTSTESLLL